MKTELLYDDQYNNSKCHLNKQAFKKSNPKVVISKNRDMGEYKLIADEKKLPKQILWNERSLRYQMS